MGFCVKLACFGLFVVVVVGAVGTSIGIHIVHIVMTFHMENYSTVPYTSFSTFQLLQVYFLFILWLVQVLAI